MIEMIEHPRSGEKIYGFKLRVGDLIRPEFYFDDFSGKWELCNCFVPFNTQFASSGMIIVVPSNQN